MKTHTLSSLALAILTATAVQADEQGDIERITVTSDFRGQQIQTLAASASVADQARIAARQAQHLEDILNVAANVNFNSGASRGRFIQIRGIGERSQFSEPVNPSVGFVIDDLDFSGTVAIGTLFDVEQVEILRGPQATEFGASALAGMVKIKTVDPSAEASGKLEATLASENTWSLGGAYGNSITDKLQFRASVQQYKSDGFIENIYLDRDDTDNLDELSSRLKLRYLASDRVQWDLNYQYIDIDNGYDAFSLDNDGKTRSDEPGFDRQETHGISLKGQFEQAWGQVQAIFGYSTSDMEYGYDEDWTFVGFHPWEYSSTDYYFRDRDTLSVDLRAVSNDHSRLFSDTTDWVVGFYYKDTDEDLLRQYTFNDGDFTSNYQPANYAVYGQTDSYLTESVLLSLGVRADRFDMAYVDNSGFTEEQQDTIVGGKAVISYLAQSSTVYASISRGYKAGGFNPDQRVSEQQRLFDPEYNWNYEVGVKAFNDNGYVRVAAFYMERKDTQISDFDVIIHQDNAPEFIDIIDNADTGRNKGLEIEAGWQLTDDLELSFSAGWLDATFGGFTTADGSFVAKQDQAQAPKYTFNIAGQWYLTESLFWRVEVDGKDEYRFSDGHDELSPSYALVNTEFNWSLEHVVLSLWAKNLFDEEYYVRGFGGFSNDPRDFYETPEPYYQLGDGLQYGVTASYQF